jgi:hypothetical protein
MRSGEVEAFVRVLQDVPQAAAAADAYGVLTRLLPAKQLDPRDGAV